MKYEAVSLKCALTFLFVLSGAAAAQTPVRVLQAADFKHYIDAFNQSDTAPHTSFIANSDAWVFLENNIPLFDSPDPEVNEIYYFRWWTYRKHIKETPEGFVITEFLPEVSWAGKDNSIDCAAGHHFHEGRWLANSKYLDDYAVFWFRKGGEPRRYSFWAAESLWARYLVSGNDILLKALLPDLIENYNAWERDHLDANGLFWQIDDRDGMEMGIGGNGYRPTINSYMYGDALAIAKVASLTGQKEIAQEFADKAAKLKRLVEGNLWNPKAQFYEVVPRGPDSHWREVREELGYTPWYFNLPDSDKSAAWVQLLDTNGFRAPFGPTTAERRHAQYRVSYEGHECQWNGPSWPFATAVTLTALANLLDNYQQSVVSKQDYFDVLKSYTHSQHLQLPDGRMVPWIDEDLNPTNGDWIARTLLKERGSQVPERGIDYNHSTYCDLIISGLVGLRPREDSKVEVRPLAPVSWDYFCLDRVRYHSHWLTILWDRTGDHYHQGKGLRLLADGELLASADSLQPVQGILPPAQSRAAHGGWEKYSGNPVMGGKYGTCFDISTLKEGDAYRMWVSWRPKQSVALVESKDGIIWGEPPRVVLGPLPGSTWEQDINRPVVIKRDGTYHMWYTGQAREHSWIGYATSVDGIAWRRMSDKPVLSPDKAWEKAAVMCPDVIWDATAKLYRMWYSGGEQYEPDAIGYATSPDGLAWTKHAGNPIFKSDPALPWEQYKVTACQIVPDSGWYLMFYIGFRDIDHAQIGLARSKDGLSGWERLPANPIVQPDPGAWDHDACYKPYAIFEGDRWLLWYNGRHGGLEQIGMVFHQGHDLGFPGQK